jgi:hypothetical protein
MLIAVFEFFDVVIDRIHRKLAVQAFQLFLGGFAPLRKLAQQFLELLVQVVDIVLNRALFGFR